MNLHTSVHGITTITTDNADENPGWVTFTDEENMRIAIHAPTDLDRAGKTQWLRGLAATILTAIDQPGTRHTIGKAS